MIYSCACGQEKVFLIKRSKNRCRLWGVYPQRLGDRRAQSDATIGLAQQQYPAVAGDVAAVELRLDAAGLAGWKVKRGLGTLQQGPDAVFLIAETPGTISMKHEDGKSLRAL